MRVQREVNAASRLVILRVMGDLGDDELLRLVGELEKATEKRTDFSFLIDLRQADGQSVTSVGVHALADQALVLSPDSRRAVVVPSDLGFGMARMYELLRDARGGSTRVFRDYDEAEQWVTTAVR